MVSVADGLFGVGILVSLFLCWLAVTSHRRWDEPGVTAFAAFVGLLGLGGVSGGVASLLFSPRIGEIEFAPETAELIPWVPIGIVALLLSFLPWAVFTLQYTGRYTLVTRRMVAGLLAPYVLVVVIIVLDVADLDLFPADVIEPLLGGLAVIYLFGLVTVGIALVLSTTWGYGHLSIWTGVALVVAVLSNFMLLNSATEVEDTVAFSELAIGGMYVLAYGVPALALGLAVFHFRLFETTAAVGRIGERTIARETDDLVFVVDNEDRLVKLNEAALETIDVSRGEVLGSPLQAVLGHGVQELREVETLPLDTAAGTRQYDPGVSTITDQHDRELGFLVTLHDVTDRELREQRLTVLNRVLRHNLRNKVDVLKGNAELLEAEPELPPERERDAVGTIAETADAIAQLGHDARAIDQFVSEGTATADVDVVTVVDEALAAVDPAEGVAVRRQLPDTAPVETNRLALAGALESTLDNAVTHAESTVEIAVENTDGQYRITVADDGAGIPDRELEYLESGTETPLQHGTGLGLWQLKWAVTTMGGDLSFDTGDGTTVTFTVPDTRRDA